MGALALRAAKRGCRVKTITLSEEQFAYAQALFEREGVSDRVEIVLEDYRLQSGQYDAVLSCEMIEAVGREYLESYFRIVSESLKPGAKAVIQAITIPDERYEAYSRSCDWIQKHIFPGGICPRRVLLKRMCPVQERLALLQCTHSAAITRRLCGAGRVISIVLRLRSIRLVLTPGFVVNGIII